MIKLFNQKIRCVDKTFSLISASHPSQFFSSTSPDGNTPNEPNNNNN